MINVNALPIVDAFTSNGQPLVAILGPNHEVYWEAVKKMEGILPLIFESRKGGPLKEYKIYGNAPYQEWTPSPEKERTANLFDENTWDNVTAMRGTIEKVANGFKITATASDAYSVTYGSSAPQCTYQLKVGGTYTLSWEIDNTHEYGIVYLFTGIGTASNILTNVVASRKSVTFTMPSNHNTLSFRIGVAQVGSSLTYTNIMLNEGSTALPYEPYGYREKTGPCEVKGVGERTENLIDVIQSNVVFDTPSNRTTVVNRELTIRTEQSTSFAIIPINTVRNLKGKTLTMSFETNSVDTTNSQHSAFIYCNKDGSTRTTIAEIGNKKSFTITIPQNTTESDDRYIAFRFYKLNISSLTFSNIMLNEGSTALPYEPYGYKTTIVDEGKNLFDDENHGNRLDTNGNFIEEANSFCTDYISAIAGQKYSVDCFIEHADTSSYAWILCCYDDNKKMVRRYTNLTRSFSFTIQMNEKYFIICKRCPSSASINRVQLELGANTTPYVPYREPIETTIYHDEPYFTGDYVYKDKDGGVEHREWEKYVCTGNENLTLHQNFSDHVSVRLPLPVPNKSEFNGGSAWSTHLKAVTFTEFYSAYKVGICVHRDVENSTAYIAYTNMMSVDDYKQWLKSEYDKGTPVTVYYQLATPTDTPKDLPDIVTASGYNSIDTDTQIKPEKMEIAYR